MVERLKSKIDVALVAGSEGKGALSPCGDCRQEPKSCGQILHSQGSVECARKQQTILRNGNRTEENVIQHLKNTPIEDRG